LCGVLLLSQSTPQDLPRPGANDKIMLQILGSVSPRKLAVADVKQSSKVGSASTEALAKIFNDTLWADLENSGVVTMVSKSFYPKDQPGTPAELLPVISSWAQPPTSAQALVFGNLTTNGDRMTIEGYLYDVTGSTRPGILDKRFPDEAMPEAARMIAHRFANEIIANLGGGISGITESKIYFTSTRTGHKEIWSMDYDGANQHQITRYGNITMTPAVSPDGGRLAYTSYAAGNPDIYVLALDTGRQLTFRNLAGHLNTTPSFSPDGKRIVYAGSRTADTQIYLADSSGGNAIRLTDSHGVSIEPAFNPRTGDQIAFVSGRSGVPQVYVMDTSGSNVRKLSGGQGDAVNPAWAPNGQLLAFSWTRGYAPGNYNIFVMDVAGGNLLQLTYGAGKNEHPSWAPDGRHIVFSSNRVGKRPQIYTMLADGTQVRALTTAGVNEEPVWSPR